MGIILNPWETGCNYDIYKVSIQAVDSVVMKKKYVFLWKKSHHSYLSVLK